MIDSKITDSKVLDCKVIVALDYADASSALNLVNQLDPSLCKLKVGKELFTAAGPQLVEKLVAKNFQVFLDLKFHDIPNTVAKACKAASDLGVWMLNVHASGGLEMMQAAKQAVDNSANQPLLIAVTVLTSMNEAQFSLIGINGTLEDHVIRLAKLTKQAGLDGVVCSAGETARLKKELGTNFCLVTPGIRPTNTSLDDQKRVASPAEAIKMGSHYLVIGRPITQTANPIEVLTAINQEIQSINQA
jgi:orotidine-5'-phosphate decarboxylase